MKDQVYLVVSITLMLGMVYFTHQQTKFNEAMVKDQLVSLELDYSTSVRLMKLEREVHQLKECIVEFQEWREIVTIASRSGWGAANRYIAASQGELDVNCTVQSLHQRESETTR